MKAVEAWINKNFLKIFLVFLIFLNTLPILAPIFLYVGFNSPAKAIYFVYSFFCHQQHWKSLHVFDHQCAWCARDMFIWGSMLVVLVLVMKRKINPLTFTSLIFYSAPMAFDGGLQTISTIAGFSGGNPLYISNNFFRMVTGTLFGSAFGLYTFPRVKKILTSDELENTKRSRKFKITLTHKKLVGKILIFMTVLYILLIQIWSVTSVRYLPSNFLDSEIKLPPDKNEWFVRRKNT
jgi:uncharacterized membrane protein